MRRFKNILIVLILTAACFLLLRCSPGSSETGNAFTINGSVVSMSGERDLIVYLIPENFNPINTDCSLSVYKTVVDCNGNYVFDLIPKGIYYLGAVDSMLQYSLLKGPIEFVENSVYMGTDTLKKSSTVLVSFPDDSLSKKPIGVFIKGTTIFTYVYDSTRYAVLQHVPSGDVKIMQITLKNETETFVDSLTVKPGDTVTVSYKNRPPVIISKKPAKSLFSYDTIYYDTIRAKDPDSDQIVFTKVEGPESLKIDSSSGVIFWNTAQDSNSSYQIIIRVSDCNHLSSYIQWGVENRNTRLTPTPNLPEGESICRLDSTYLYKVDTCECFGQLAMYRFVWGSGDTSLWSFDCFASHTWTKSGSYTVKAQARCADYRGESTFSDPISISVQKSEISQIPKLTVSQSVAVNTLYNPEILSYQCDGEVIFNCYINDSIVSGWKKYQDLMIKLDQPGVYNMRVAAWCDTARKIPSPLSEPCSLTVYSDTTQKTITTEGTPQYFDSINARQ